MNTFNKIFIIAIALAISTGVFVLLDVDQNVNETVITSAQELTAAFNQLFDGLSEKLHASEQQEFLEQERSTFINKVKKDELNTQQLTTVAARLTNIQLKPDTISTAELATILNVSADTLPLPKKHKGPQLTKDQEKHLARKIHYVIEFKNDINRIKEDSVRNALVRHVMVTPDSDLQLMVDDNVKNDPRFAENPEASRFLEQLPGKDWVKFVPFSESPHIAQQALEYFAPFIPSDVQISAVINTVPNQNFSIQIDSSTVKLPSNFFDPAGWEKFAKEIEKAAKQWEEEVE